MLEQEVCWQMRPERWWQGWNSHWHDHPAWRQLVLSSGGA